MSVLVDKKVEQELLAQFVRKALATPFLDKGRTWVGVDCWGLVALAYSELMGISLPLYSGNYDSANDRPTLSKLVEQERKTWVQVDRVEVKPLDCVVLLMAGRPVHVGLMIDKRQFLHCSHRIGTVVERVDSVLWQERVEGYYRHVACCD